MIEKFFEGTLYYDFPSFEVAIFSLMLSFVLSSVIAFTYQLTFRGSVFPNTFFQAIILSSMVTSMIMMAVGSNLAVGFGIIGAVAIIRFRTLIQNPRNIIFMFAGISIGIATGVYGYAIAMAGTLIFCTIAFLLHFSPYGVTETEAYEVTLFFEDFTGTDKVLFGSHCEKFELTVQRKNMEGVTRLEYIVNLRKDEEIQNLFKHLKSIEQLKEIRIEERRRAYQL